MESFVNKNMQMPIIEGPGKPQYFTLITDILWDSIIKKRDLKKIFQKSLGHKSI